MIYTTKRSKHHGTTHLRVVAVVFPYAADACGADWYQQAVERARSYLDMMSFSRQGLIDQLEYDGFLYDQAVYGVDKVY